MKKFINKLIVKIAKKFGYGFTISILCFFIVLIGIILLKFEKTIAAFFIVIGVFLFLICLLIELSHYLKRKIKLKKLTKINFDDAMKMNPYEFESWVASQFIKNGYDAKVTKKSGDFGIDVIANYKKKKIGIQVKKYNGPVGIRAVQEALSGMKYYSLDEAMVISTASFTKQAYEMAKKTNVKLLNKEEMIDFFYKINSNKMIQ